MMKIKTFQTVILSLGIGMILGTGLAAFLQQKYPLEVEQSLAEIRLEEYKNAETICGEENVKVVEKCISYHKYDEDTCLKYSFDYVCDSMEHASRTEEEKVEFDDNYEQERADKYCDFVKANGEVDFKYF